MISAIHSFWFCSIYPKVGYCCSPSYYSC